MTGVSSPAIGSKKSAKTVKVFALELIFAAMKQLLRTFTFLLLVTIGQYVQYVQYVQSYSMQEIFEDSLKMNMQELGLSVVRF
jgi:hypothetical protein